MSCSFFDYDISATGSVIIPMRLKTMAEIIRNVKNIHQSTTPPGRQPIFWNDKDRVDFINRLAGGSLSVKRGERMVTARLNGCP